MYLYVWPIGLSWDHHIRPDYKPWDCDLQKGAHQECMVYPDT